MSVELDTPTIADEVLAVLATAASIAGPARVRAIEVDGADVTVYLGKPAPRQDVYLLIPDVADVLADIEGVGDVRVVVDGQPTCDEEFLHHAHHAAVRRALAQLARYTDETHHLLLRDLPDSTEKSALLRRRYALGLSNCPNSRVVPTHTKGTPWPRS